MTNEVFVSHVVIDDKVQELLDALEPLILETDKSPSNYWDDPKLREIMESFDVLDYPFERMDKNVDIADTGKILNNILK